MAAPIQYRVVLHGDHKWRVYRNHKEQTRTGQLLEAIAFANDMAEREAAERNHKTVVLLDTDHLMPRVPPSTAHTKDGTPK